MWVRLAAWLAACAAVGYRRCLLQTAYTYARITCRFMMRLSPLARLVSRRPLHVIDNHYFNRSPSRVQPQPNAFDRGENRLRVGEHCTRRRR